MLPYVLSHPAGLLTRENYDFWKFWTCPFSKSEHFLKSGHFSREGSPGQTTMLTTSAAKFWVEPRSPFFNISHHDPKTLGKPSIIVPWPECQPEFPDDADNGDGASTIFPSGQTPIPLCAGITYPVRESLTSTKKPESVKNRGYDQDVSIVKTDE